jgi:hypothetical protein
MLRTKGGPGVSIRALISTESRASAHVEGRPVTAGRKPSAGRVKLEAALVTEPDCVSLSNGNLGRRYGISRRAAAEARVRLERDGVIPVTTMRAGLDGQMDDVSDRLVPNSER